MEKKDLKELEKLEREFEKYLKKDNKGDFKIRMLLDGKKELKKKIKK